MEHLEIKTAIEGLSNTTAAALAKIQKDLTETKDHQITLEKKMNMQTILVGGENAALLEAKQKATQFLRTGKVEQKDMSGTSGPDGGYTIQDELATSIQDQLISISPVRQVARIVTLGSGTGDYKQIIGRRGATSNWVGETETRNQTSTPQLGTVTPFGGEISAYCKVTQWLLDDSSFDIEQFIASNINDEFAFREGVAFISGDGLKKPIGFLSGTPVNTADASRAFGTLKYLPTGNAGLFPASNPADILIDLMNDLNVAYRPGASWLMSSATAGVVRKFKDTTGQYIWQQSLAAGVPNLLLGYPVVICEDMPSIGANNFAIAFGNFKLGYIVVDKIGLRVIRDNITEPGWVKFYFFKRVFGGIADSNAVRLLKFSAT